MPPVLSANIPITLANKVAGYVEVSLLPNQPIQDMAPLLIDETLPSSSDQESSIQLLEQSEYRYQINVEGVSPQRWCTDRPEIFQPDTVNGRTEFGQALTRAGFPSLFLEMIMRRVI